MKGNLTLKIIFIWTILSFIIDLNGFISSINTMPFLSIIMIAIGLFIIWSAYEMTKGKKWALIVLIVFYGLHSINFYTDFFSFYTKSGINFELKIGNIGLNLFMTIIFILLIGQLVTTNKITKANTV